MGGAEAGAEAQTEVGMPHICGNVYRADSLARRNEGE